MNLFNKNFFLLWQSQLISQLGNQAHAIAIAFWVKHRTGSATMMGMVLMAANLPGLILQPLGGVLADRYSRKNILIGCDLFCGIALSILVLLLYFTPDNSTLVTPALFATAFIVGGLQALYRPSVMASVPSLVPETKLTGANSLMESTIEISNLIGSGIGGVLFRVLGAPLLFLFDGLSYFLSAFSLCFMDLPHTPPVKDVTSVKTNFFSDFFKDAAVGFRFVWKNSGMRTFFILMAFDNFFITPCIVLLPFYVEDYLKLPPDWYGFLMAAVGVGGLLGYLAVGIFQIPPRIRPYLLIGLNIFYALLVVSFGVLENRYVALILIGIVGFILSFTNVNFITLVQLHTPEDLRGRVMGVAGMISGLITPLAMGIAGIVADFVNQNIPLIYQCSGGFLAILSITMAFNKRFREFLATDEGALNA
mgnify:CR=1 FL=1